jgi:hypothetical protein
MGQLKFTAGFTKVAEKESNKEMVEGELSVIHKKAKYLYDLIHKISDSKDCPPWVLSKITQAKTHVQDVMDYVSGEAVK